MCTVDQASLLSYSNDSQPEAPVSQCQRLRSQAGRSSSSLVAESNPTWYSSSESEFSNTSSNASSNASSIASSIPSSIKLESQEYSGDKSSGKSQPKLKKPCRTAVRSPERPRGRTVAHSPARRQTWMPLRPAGRVPKKEEVNETNTIEGVSGAQDVLVINDQEVLARKRELREAEILRRREAEAKYLATGDSRVFDFLFAPFVIRDTSKETDRSWRWSTDYERWYIDDPATGSRYWGPVS